MTPRGGPTLDFSLFGRYFLDLAIFYPGAFLCLAPLWEHVKAPRRTAVLTAALVTVICLAAAALCAIFELDSNILLLPTLLAAFWLLRWRVGPEVSVSQTAFLFAVAGVMTAVCSLLSVVLNARAEVGNDAPACLVSTSLLKLGLSAVLCIIFWFTAVQWSLWLLREYRGEAFWQSAWPLPTIYAAFLVFCMPLDPAVVLINRLMIISVLAVTISLLGILFAAVRDVSGGSGVHPQRPARPGKPASAWNPAATPSCGPIWSRRGISATTSASTSTSSPDSPRPGRWMS